MGYYNYHRREATVANSALVILEIEVRLDSGSGGFHGIRAFQ